MMTRSRCSIAVEVISSEQHEFVMAQLELRSDVWNNQELSELVHDYCLNTFKSRDLRAALQANLHAHQTLITHQPLLPQYEEASATARAFFHELARVFTQPVQMREALQSLDNIFVEKLDCVGYWKKVSAVSFTAAAAASAAVAAVNANLKMPAVAATAAAASVLFGAGGSRMDSLLKKHKIAAKKQREMIRAMIIGAKICITGLSNVYVSACKLRLQTESMWRMVGDHADAVDARKKLAEVEKSLEELREKSDEYFQDMRRVETIVLDTIMRHLSN